MLSGMDAGNLAESDSFRYLYEATSEADGLILASPIYNWSCCSELQKYVEWMGTASHGSEQRRAFYDKTVTFVCAAGLPHSYMAFGSLAVSMMLDYKCIINPYQVYLYDRHWDESGRLAPEALAKINKAMIVMMEITQCLQARTYQSSSEV
jgi:FMN reductase